MKQRRRLRFLYIKKTTDSYLEYKKKLKKLVEKNQS